MSCFPHSSENECPRLSVHETPPYVLLSGAAAHLEINRPHPHAQSDGAAVEQTSFSQAVCSCCPQQHGGNITIRLEEVEEVGEVEEVEEWGGQQGCACAGRHLCHRSELQAADDDRCPVVAQLPHPAV
jgi:hypothetical protein